jgi:hypothetical protein
LIADAAQFHPRARRVYDYWREIHPADGLPGRQHVDPSALPDVLPNLRLIEVHRDPMRFRYRLVGSRVDVVHGRNLANRWLDEAHAGDPRLDNLLTEYRKVAETGQPSWRRGVPWVVPEPSCVTVEALRLPLARDGVVVDMVLGLSIYFAATGREVNSTLQRVFGY